MFADIALCYLLGVAILCDFICLKVVGEKQYIVLAPERRKSLVLGILFVSLFWFISAPYLYWNVSENGE